MIDEGYIKYECHWENKALAPIELSAINHYRELLIEKGMIGHDDKNDVGFGNISMRIMDHLFLISGTQTGHIPQLDLSHYAMVNDYSIEQNRLSCIGETKASSESLSHAVIYEQSDSINNILHIHFKPLWEQLMNKVPTTGKDVPYGTPEMANAIANCYQNEGLAEQKILVMAGHEDGIIAFGKNFEEAWSVIEQYL